MKTQAVLSIKIDKSLKDAAKMTAAKFGASLNGMITAMLKEVVRTKTIPVSLGEKPSAWLKKEIALAKKDIQNGDVTLIKNAKDLDAFFENSL